MDRSEWEYQVVTIPVTTRAFQVEATLTAAGICGWELVHIQGDRYYFKRPR